MSPETGLSGLMDRSADSETLGTVKILKIGTPEIITIIVLQLEQLDFSLCCMFKPQPHTYEKAKSCLRKISWFPPGAPVSTNLHLKTGLTFTKYT